MKKTTVSNNTNCGAVKEKKKKHPQRYPNNNEISRRTHRRTNVSINIKDIDKNSEDTSKTHGCQNLD